MKDFICRICENTTGNKYVAREMIFGYRDEFVYYECCACGCLQIETPPQDLEKYYPSHYYSFDPPTIYKLSRIKDALKRKRTNFFLGEKTLVGRILQKLTGNPNLPNWLQGTGVRVDHKILDVGCGSGSLLVQLRNEGFYRVYGVDPFIKADILYENGVSIYKRDLSQIDGKYNLIMLHHSFEHMPDPHCAFGLLQNKITDDGLLLIRIPTVSSYAWKKYKTNWFQLDAPRHLFLHSIKSIEFLARQYSFQIEEVLFDSNAKQFWASEQYLRDIHHLADNSYRNNPRQSIFTQSQINEFEIMAQELNEKREGDQACFYLRKSLSVA